MKDQIVEIIQGVQLKQVGPSAFGIHYKVSNAEALADQVVALVAEHSPSVRETSPAPQETCGLEDVREVLGLPPVEEDIRSRFGPATYTEDQVKAYARRVGAPHLGAARKIDTLRARLDRITTDAIADSLAEIATELERRYGPGVADATAKRTYSVFVETRPQVISAMVNRQRAVVIRADPLHTPTPTGQRTSMGFPVLVVTEITDDPEGVAAKVAALLQDGQL